MFLLRTKNEVTLVAFKRWLVMSLQYRSYQSDKVYVRLHVYYGYKALVDWVLYKRRGTGAGT